MRHLQKMKSILTVNQVSDLIESIRQEDKKIVVAGGCFDILHIGHITLLENAKKEGDVLIVMLESDEAIKVKKGMNRPIHTQEQRAHMVSSLRSVDFVILLPSSMKNTDYDDVLKQVKPAIIATTLGDPYAFHKERQAKETGAALVYVNQPIANISTSSILDLLSKEI